MATHTPNRPELHREHRDCWNQIGVFGDGTCPELAKVIHCRNCPVYAAGGRSLLLIGPPGAGTSMLARRRTTILPAMTLAEALDTTRIHRVAGLTGDRTAFVTTQPCRAPPSHPLGCGVDRRRAGADAGISYNDHPP
jgi:Magnesium chelatase, subunit ChlI